MNQILRYLWISVFGLLSVGMLACSSSKDVDSVDHQVDLLTDGTSTIIGRTFSVEDCTPNVASRVWQFEDALPATSNEAAVDLKFESTGTKNCSLEIVFTDGYTSLTPFTVEVLEYEIAINIDCPKAYIGDKITVTDLTQHVSSRTWTFADGAISYLSGSRSEANVVFSTTGVKECSLKIDFDNGASSTHNFTVEILQGLTGKIATSNLNARNTVITGSTIEFSVSELTGAPASYQWSFPGATVAQSTEPAPSAIWQQEGSYKVSCTMVDGSQTTVLTTVVLVADAGRTPLLRPIEQYDNWNFESSNLGPYILWSNGDAPQNLQIVAGGANSSAHCLKVTVDSSIADTWQLFPRDNWNNNAHLIPGKKYELSFYARATDTKIADASGMGLIAGAWVVNFLPDWSWNGILGKQAAANWSEFFTESFSAQGETRLFQADGVVDGSYNPDLLLSDAWKRCRFEFTAPVDTGETLFLNTYPFLLLYANSAGSFYLDDIQIYEID